MECLQEQRRIFRSGAHVCRQISVSPTFAGTPDVRFTDNGTEVAFEMLKNVLTGALGRGLVNHCPELPHSILRNGLVYPVVVRRWFEPPCSGKFQHDNRSEEHTSELQS